MNSYDCGLFSLIHKFNCSPHSHVNLYSNNNKHENFLEAKAIEDRSYTLLIKHCFSCLENLSFFRGGDGTGLGRMQIIGGRMLYLPTSLCLCHNFQSLLSDSTFLVPCSAFALVKAEMQKRGYRGV